MDCRRKGYIAGTNLDTVDHIRFDKYVSSSHAAYIIIKQVFLVEYVSDVINFQNSKFNKVG